MTKMEVYIDRIDDDHQDSFWYDGIVAEAGKYRLYAAGEIDVRQEDENGEYIGLYDGKARDDFVMPKNDKELDKLYGNEDGYHMIMNNWFEVVNEHGDCIGDICDDYDSGIEWLKEVADGEY